MIGLLLLACQSEPTPPPPAPPVEAPVLPKPGLPVLALNGTERWTVDAHTRTVMGEIRATLANAKVAGPQDTAALSTTLQTQLDRLIEGCTLEDTAHDELHVFLLAFLPEVTALKDDPNAHVANRRVDTLRTHIAGYDQAFE